MHVVSPGRGATIFVIFASPVKKKRREIQRFPSSGSKATPRPLLVAGTFGPLGTQEATIGLPRVARYKFNLEGAKDDSYPQ